MTHPLIKVCVPVVVVVMTAGATPLFPQDSRVRDALDILTAAYPDALARHDGKALYWRDGTATTVSGADDAKAFPELLRRASIVDQFRLQYPRGPLGGPPAVDSDPGRFRNTEFFKKMYGDCARGEVAPRLVPLVWLPKSWGKAVSVTSVNRVNERLKAVSADIDALPDKIKRAAYPIAGTYNCRVVADTGLPSPHGFGIAIDLNIAFSDYWYWGSHQGRIEYRNRMPTEIVDIFERQGFIWGGKWYHYDTMHFEYRPELLDISIK
jgi:hypothetical protein